MEKTATTTPPAVQSQPSKALSTRESESLLDKSKQESNETSVAAVATKARAEIEAAYVMAKKFPRNEDDARVKILKTCAIPSFAEKAKYRKPMAGSFIIGPSIRLAEEIFRQWGHIRSEVGVLYEDNVRRIMQVNVIDLQTGANGSAQFIVEKAVERKSAAGRQVISERINSSGEKVSLVVATEDEVLTKSNAMASKVRRNLILQIIPVYILEDALAVVDDVNKKGIKENPDKVKKEVIDNLAKLGVMPSDIVKWLGHPLEQIIADEVLQLKEIFFSIKEGETTWPAVMEVKENKDADPKGTEKASLPLKAGDQSTHTNVRDTVGRGTSAAYLAKVAKVKDHATKNNLWPVDLGVEDAEFNAPEAKLDEIIKANNL